MFSILIEQGRKPVPWQERKDKDKIHKWPFQKHVSYTEQRGNYPNGIAASAAVSATEVDRSGEGCRVLSLDSRYYFVHKYSSYTETKSMQQLNTLSVHCISIYMWMVSLIIEHTSLHDIYPTSPPLEFSPFDPYICREAWSPFSSVYESLSFLQEALLIHSYQGTPSEAQRLDEIDFGELFRRVFPRCMTSEYGIGITLILARC